MDEKHFLFGSLQSSFALSLVCDGEFFSFKGSNSNFLLSSIELFALFIRWVILEDSVGTKNNGSNKLKEIWVLNIVSDFKFLISFFL
jgi:hypothetical protein